MGQRRYEINEANLKEAIEFLGIKQPVYIKFHGRRARRNETVATCTFLPTWRALGVEQRFFEKWVKETGHPGYVETYHKIVLKSYLSASYASKCLWHELCHAMQAERSSKGDPNHFGAILSWNKADDRDRQYKYDDRPCEIEALAYEEFSDELPLCVEGRWLKS